MNLKRICLSPGIAIREMEITTRGVGKGIGSSLMQVAGGCKHTVIGIGVNP